MPATEPAVGHPEPQSQQLQRVQNSGRPTRSSGDVVTEVAVAPVARAYCSNPFRIPNHKITRGLRTVPRAVSNLLVHVSLGRSICADCRLRVHDMLKLRKQLSTSARLEGGPKPSRRSEANKPRRSDGSAPAPAPAIQKQSSTPPPAPNAPSPVSRPKTPAPPVEPSAALEPPPPIPPLAPAPLESRDVCGPATVSRAGSSVSNLSLDSSLSLENTMSRRGRHQLQQSQLPLDSSLDSSQNKTCCFCGLTDDNEIQFGKFYEQNGIVTHYYCLLLSSNMEQKGNDDEGILGFLIDDIHREIRRGKRLVCSHCKKNGATLGCCNTKCKRIFHFPCGLKAGSLHQFFGEFRSYCINHRPKQKIDDRVKKEVQKMTNILCYICYEDVIPLDSNGTLWAPCCKKNAWFHRKCVQQLAMSAGYFFKCPLCNNKREFQSAMLEYGIYIPRQDASWELVPNAFEELLYRHDRCDAARCMCPKGRTYTSNNAKWELVLCRMCGSQGTHIFCGQLKWVDPVWECQECISIIKKPSGSSVSTNESSSNSNQNSRNNSRNLQGTSLNVTINEFEDDSDSDISVGKEPFQNNSNNIPSIPQLKLRPGPRSFKLQQVQKLQSAKINEESINDNNSKPNNSSMKTPNDIICLDSDEEAVEILCENVMKSSIRRNQIQQYNTPSQSYSSNIMVVDQIPNTESSFSNENNMNSTMGEINTVIPLEIVDQDDDCPFNIIISNVTSVPPEFFASVPEAPEEVSQAGTQSLITDLPVIHDTSNHLKRNHPCDEENDYQSSIDTAKRARLENASHQVDNTETPREIEDTNSTNSKIARIESTDTTLTNVMQSPSKAASTVLIGSNGMSSSLESCDGHAGTSPAGTSPAVGDSSSSFGQLKSTNSGTIKKQSESTAVFTGSDSSTENNSTVRVVLENGSTSHCSSGGSGSRGSMSRNSSCDRSGMMPFPNIVRLIDLKFKIRGNNLELSYRACKIQVKMNVVENVVTANDEGNIVSSSVSPFAGSNQNLSSEKSSKSFQIRSDDSEESYKNIRSLRIRNQRTFVYEDDNTLLEYPTSASPSTPKNAKIIKKSYPDDKNNAIMLECNDLKENWNPEISGSSYNTFENANNNIQAMHMDNKNSNINYQDKLNNVNENSILVSQKDDSDIGQSLLRRSNRIVRHFRSVQQSNVLQSNSVNGDSTDSYPNNYVSSPITKSNQIASSDQYLKSLKSLRALNNLDVTETDKHLKNVDLNDLRFTGKVNDMLNSNEIESESDLKVSIDLHKISNLISAKPDLFFTTKNMGISMHVYSENEKIRVKYKPGEKIFLTKSQSFGCLLDIVKDSDLPYFKRRSKSLENLLEGNKNNVMPLTDKKDCIIEKFKKHLRRKTRQFEKHECVR